jgi:hypothetical protein
MRTICDDRSHIRRGIHKQIKVSINSMNKYSQHWLYVFYDTLFANLHGDGAHSIPLQAAAASAAVQRGDGVARRGDGGVFEMIECRRRNMCAFQVC